MPQRDDHVNADFIGVCSATSGLGAMSRRDCPRCLEREALFAGSKCCACGADISQSKRRGRGRPPRKFTVKSARASLRTPIADNPEALLALMKAKP
jgi:hypothetical protein